MVISRLIESRRHLDALAEAADEARRDSRWEDAAAAAQAMLDHPCSRHVVLEYEVLDELHQALRMARRFDEAIDAKRAAIAAGYRSSPDPEADIAETLLDAGRRAEADQLYAELRRRDPDDVWLYNSAGFAYAGVDDRAALRWCLDGIEVAIATGDADQVVTQLLEMAERQWSELGEPVDHSLVERVEGFTASWQPVPYRPRWGELPPAPVMRRCEHCGFDPDEPPPEIDIWARAVEPAARPMPTVLALAWFPADEWATARERWPELAELPADHAAYSQRIEARMKWLVKRMPGHTITVSPLAVNELVAAEGERAGTGEARSEQAARILEEGRALRWPPARNDRCWCGSGRKYKQCCGPTAPAADDRTAAHDHAE